VVGVFPPYSHVTPFISRKYHSFKPLQRSYRWFFPSHSFLRLLFRLPKRRGSILLFPTRPCSRFLGLPPRFPFLTFLLKPLTPLSVLGFSHKSRFGFWCVVEGTPIHFCSVFSLFFPPPSFSHFMSNNRHLLVVSLSTLIVSRTQIFFF